MFSIAPPLLGRKRPLVGGERQRKSKPRKLRLEKLAERRLLAVDIVFDYSYDDGFFNVPERRAALESAAEVYEERIRDTLTAIPAPTAGNSWDAVFDNPDTGADIRLRNLELSQDEVRVYLGSRDLAGSTLGIASTGYSLSYTNVSWLDTVTKRGQTGEHESSVWGGSITFDSSTNWSANPDGPAVGQSDLFSTALHELGHLFGVSMQADSTWTGYVKSLAQLSVSDQALVDYQAGNYFTGPEAMALYGGPVPVGAGHFKEGVSLNGQEAAFDPSLKTGTRKPMSQLDWAALIDLGWEADAVTATPSGWADTDITWPTQGSDGPFHVVVKGESGEKTYFSGWVYGNQKRLTLPNGCYQVLVATPGQAYQQYSFDVVDRGIGTSSEDSGWTRFEWSAASTKPPYYLIIRKQGSQQTIVAQWVHSGSYQRHLAAGNYEVQVAPSGSNYRTVSFSVAAPTSDGFIYSAPGKGTVYWSPTSGQTHNRFSLYDSQGVLLQQYWTTATSVNLDLPIDDYRVSIAAPGQTPRTINVLIDDFTTKDFTPIFPVTSAAAGPTNFSWKPVPGAVAYYFQLRNASGAQQTASWTYGTSVNATTTPGDLHWRVIPLNERSEQARDTTWVPFQALA